MGKLSKIEIALHICVLQNSNIKYVYKLIKNVLYRSEKKDSKKSYIDQ